MTELSRRPFPRGALVGATLMVGAALTLATVVRLSGIDISSLPAARPVEVRYLQFIDRPDGAVAVQDARSRELVQLLPGGTNGFLRATMRNFARERRGNGIGSSAAFKLTASSDGRLILEDSATGSRIDLEAFGQTNAAVFARFLSPPPGDRDHD